MDTIFTLSFMCYSEEENVHVPMLVEVGFIKRCHYAKSGQKCQQKYVFRRY